jgi:hypothetical protein
MRSWDGVRGAVPEVHVDVVAAGAVVWLGTHICVSFETAEQVSVVLSEFLGTVAMGLVAPFADVLESELAYRECTRRRLRLIASVRGAHDLWLMTVSGFPG